MKEKNLQDISEPTNLDRQSLRPPDGITAGYDPKAFKYTVMPLSLATAAFNDREFEIQGEKIYYMEGQSRLQIRLNSNTNDLVDLYPGRKIIAPFKRFFVTAPMADEVAKLIICSPYWVSMHGEGVEVNTLIRDKSGFRETELGRSFMGYVVEQSQALHYCHVQLWNPADSGVVAILESIYPTFSGSDASLSIGCSTVALTDDDGTECNKYCGLAGPQCELRSLTHSSKTYPACTAYTGSGSKEHINFMLNNQKWLIKPARGLLLLCTSVDKTIYGYFQWIELPEGDISNFAGQTIELPT